MELKKIFIFCWLIFTLFSTSAYSSPPKNCRPGTTCTDTIIWQGVPRTFSYYLPQSYTDLLRYHNLVVALHGAGSTGPGLENTILQGSFDKLANHTRTIVAYPDAKDGAWNDGSESTSANIDDVGFIRSLLKYFIDNYHVNPTRLYVIGMSSGGMMAYRLACESADMITAIATVAASMPPSLQQTCKPTRHISVLMINGTRDPMMPWNGHEILSVTGDKRGDKLSVPETFRAWLQINHIDTALHQEPYATPSYDGTWAWTASAKGFDGTDVILYTVYGGGHAWPGGAQYLPTQYIGKTSNNMDGTKIVWQFLISHRLVQPNTTQRTSGPQLGLVPYSKK
jgi:polyhydroxybutyrate depolymerase